MRPGPDLRQLRRPAGQPSHHVAAPVDLDLEACLLEPPDRQRTGLVFLRRPADPVRADAASDVENVVQPPLESRAHLRDPDHAAGAAQLIPARATFRASASGKRPDGRERERRSPRRGLDDVREERGRGRRSRRESSAGNRSPRRFARARPALRPRSASPFHAIETAPATTMTVTTSESRLWASSAVASRPAALASPIQRSGLSRLPSWSESRPHADPQHRSGLEDREDDAGARGRARGRRGGRARRTTSAGSARRVEARSRSTASRAGNHEASMESRLLRALRREPAPHG